MCASNHRLFICNYLFDLFFIGVSFIVSVTDILRQSSDTACTFFNILFIPQKFSAIISGPPCVHYTFINEAPFMRNNFKY